MFFLYLLVYLYYFIIVMESRTAIHMVIHQSQVTWKTPSSFPPPLLAFRNYRGSSALKSQQKASPTEVNQLLLLL